MKHVHYTKVESEEVAEAGAQGVRVRWLISAEDGAPNFHMRRFELSPGGNTPRHSHPWEHEVYVLEGEGTVLSAERQSPFGPGDAVFIPEGEEHSFAADRGKAVAFLCLIPAQKKQ